METQEICESTGTEFVKTPDDVELQVDTVLSSIECDQLGKNNTDNGNSMETDSSVSEELQNDRVRSEQTNIAASACVSNDLAKLQMDTDMPISVLTDFQSVKHSMLTHLSESEAHFKSQQRGEPDLTIQEKYDIACEKLLKNPANFLSQFGQFIQQEHLIYFTQFEGQYEIDFHVREIHKQFNKSICAKTVNNRRYSAMQKLMEDGEYFSEEEMKYRDPLLYEEMIGQYLTDDEIQSRVDKTDLKFSSILLKHIDQIEENKLYYYQKNQQECQTEETESDDQEEDEEEESELESEEETENKKPKISSEEQQELKTEYIQMMQEKFLTGQDHHFFDYSTVDKNSEYDSLPTIDQDEQDKYFDDDDFD